MSEKEESAADWGDSAGSQSAALEVVREENSYKRFERSFQLRVLGLISILAVFFVAIDSFANKTLTRDVLVVILPLFSFVLGRLDNRSQ